MYRKIIVLLAAFAVLISACGPMIVQEEPMPDPVTPTIDPNMHDTGIPGEEDPVDLSDWEPQPGDDELTRGEVTITTSDILTLESFPPQFVVHIEGEKGNPCAYIRAVSSEPGTNGRIDIEVYALIDPLILCAAVTDQFEINFPLGSLPTGNYTVFVNGEQVGEIMAP
ncbi:MAG: hypothetical protein EHM41_20060 [Chloroflexi bacterium]|nr:MAG: hypothetical protein EHM41_20060 [Chloroflexota bacterium]